MGEERVRTHVVIPRELVEEVDELVGHRRRSDFMTEAVREKLQRARRERVLRESAGALTGEYPAWATPEKVSAWVRENRELDEAGFRQAWGEREEV
jgi:metal-responsive CopG/Arc/MetJ family transcriptional regulator